MMPHNACVRMLSKALTQPAVVINLWSHMDERHLEDPCLPYINVQVLTEPPTAGLPWPAGAQQRLAAPRAVRPQEDAALASATMRILHGECRHGIFSARLFFDHNTLGS